jgi:hypothetical protein
MRYNPSVTSFTIRISFIIALYLAPGRTRSLFNNKTRQPRFGILNDILRLSSSRMSYGLGSLTIKHDARVILTTRSAVTCALLRSYGFCLSGNLTPSISPFPVHYDGTRILAHGIFLISTSLVDNCALYEHSSITASR